MRSCFYFHSACLGTITGRTWPCLTAIIPTIHGFNDGVDVVSAGVTNLPVDRGCYLAVPLVPFRSPGRAEESSLVRALIGCAPSTRSLLVHLLLAATGRRHPTEPVLRDFTKTCAHPPRSRSVPDSLSRTWHDPARRHWARSP